MKTKSWGLGTNFGQIRTRNFEASLGDTVLEAEDLSEGEESSKKKKKKKYKIGKLNKNRAWVTGRRVPG